MPKRSDIRKVLLIGSGPIQIGQAAEFDYSGSQACKTLKEEGISVVLINSNPATIMTDPEMADKIYIEPIDVDIISKIIEKERPDGLVAGFGGQTALNISTELKECGIIDKYGVKFLGTSFESILNAEDRNRFKDLMVKINEPVPMSKAVSSIEEAVAVSESLGFPLIIRPAYTLGGTGGGIANNLKELKEIVRGGLNKSRIHQVLLEESIGGWKEIEYEVIRDAKDTCIIVCNMENIDPMGIHTGESIVVAPSQTLTDAEHQMLRTASLKIIRALGVEGGSNIQFALKNGEYRVIEVNPRVSRSSALASKATGYPIARVATKIAIGLNLDEIQNDVTKTTFASFEPVVDYVVVKIPRWPFDKFPQADRRLTTHMKSTGETMAIGRTFEEALMKALRSLDIYEDLLTEYSKDDAERHIRQPTNERIFAIYNSLKRGYFDIDEIVDMTNIDPFFIKKIKKIVMMEEDLKKDLTTNYVRAKKMGFTDELIARITGKKIDDIYKLRRESGINVTYKMVDTCSAEFEAKTPYYYSTYEKSCELDPSDKKKVLIIGSGPIRIGQGIEFDYCTVHAVMALKDENIETHIINNNPETVSTDYDTSDKLFFDPITVEDVINIIEKERYYGVMVQFGGQTSVNLAMSLKEEIEKRGLNTKILGTSPEDINIAEDRDLFSVFLKRLNITQPKNGIARSFDDAKKVAKEIGYPVLVRPSYVLGGRAMEIVYDEGELERYMREAVKVTREHPVLIDKFLENAIEIDVDLVSDGSDVLIGAIMEHIEEAGIHSGDSACVIPPQSLTKREIDEIKRISSEIALNLKTIGLLNIQMAIKDGEIYVLEANPRSSRTIPYVSKATGIPLAKIAAKCMIGRSLREMGYLDDREIKRHVAVKEVVLPFDMLDGVDPVLSPEMKSTGEVMGIDYKFGIAFFKAELAANNELPLNGTVFISVGDEFKPKIVNLSKRLKDYGFSIITTRGTGKYLSDHGVETNIVKKVNEGSPNILDIIEKRDVSLIINILSSKRSRKDDYSIRKAAIGSKIPYITTLQAAKAAVDAIEILKYDKMAIKSLKEYISEF
ncbi:MAG TPA: carbamoyl-phosphate synthase large subunit [Halobacteria archaeon]|jgi:carbamoyl-phosphate synthase large subunit|nr:carbamoyl-phosphate synthase large subunit [Halobacteria archaeon]